MTTTDAAGWGIGVGFVRAIIGTPLDRYAQEEVLQSRMIFWPPPQLWRGFEVNLVRQTTKTPVSFVFTSLVSNLVPTNISSSWRGFLIGTGVAGLEALVIINPANAIRTLRMQGEGFKKIVYLDKFWTRGATATCAHHMSSWPIYMSIYEQLRQKISAYCNENITIFSAATGAGFGQVVLTSP